jgi:transposase
MPVYHALLEHGQFEQVLVCNAGHVKNVPGRKTDLADAEWLAHLLECGLLRGSFIPPADIKAVRDVIRYRAKVVQSRSSEIQRLDGVLQDAGIKLGNVASSIASKSGRAMIEALIAGERDPRVLAGLARGRLRIKHPALVEALTGRFDAHHGELARMLLDQIDALDAQIERLTTRIDELIAALPAAGAPAGGPGGPATGCAPAADPPLPALDRLDAIPGLARRGAQVILAEIGLDMARVPTAAHLVSRARLCPRTIQSGPASHPGRTGRGNRYLKGVLGEAAAAAAKTRTFLGERYRRLVKRRGKLKALVAVARAILVIVWHLLTDPTLHFHDLGADYHATRLDKHRRMRDHIRGLEALGYTVTLTAAA